MYVLIKGHGLSEEHWADCLSYQAATRLFKWDVGNDEGALSQRAPNWEMLLQCRGQQGKLWDAMSHEDENRRLEKSREQHFRETGRLFCRPTRGHKDPSKQGKNKRPCPCKDKSRQG